LFFHVNILVYASSKFSQSSINTFSSNPSLLSIIFFGVTGFTVINIRRKCLIEPDVSARCGRAKNDDLKPMLYNCSSSSLAPWKNGEVRLAELPSSSNFAFDQMLQFAVYFFDCSDEKYVFAST